MCLQPLANARRTVARASRISCSTTSGSYRSVAPSSPPPRTGSLRTARSDDVTIDGQRLRRVSLPGVVLLHDPAPRDAHPRAPLAVVQQRSKRAGQAVHVARLDEHDAVPEGRQVLGTAFPLAAD